MLLRADLACRLVVIAMLAGTAAVCAAAGRDASPEARFLAGLRQRRLFVLAEDYCRRQFDDPQLTDVHRGELTLEWSRTLVERALHSLPDDRDELWRRAADVVQTQLARPSRDPRRVVLEVQAALVDLAQGEQAYQEAEVTGFDPTRLDAARRALRRGIQHLDEVARSVADEKRRALVNPIQSPGALSGTEWTALEKNVQLERGRAQRLLGQSYPAGSADRVATISLASETLGPLVGLDPGDPVALPARIEELITLRLLGESEAFARRLASFQELQPPPELTLRVRGEAVRLLLDLRRLASALELIEKLPAELAGVVSSEWDLACLEAFVAAWKQAQAANHEADQQRWQQRAAERLRDIEPRHGPYPARRGELLVAELLRDRLGTGGPIDDVQRAAEALYRAGQIPAAIQAYEQIAEQAQKAQQPARSFEAWFTAASILQSRQDHVAAAERFRAAALAAPTIDRAGEAHLAAIWNTAQSAPRPDDVQAQRYYDLLDEHLRLWPRAASADQVRLWRAQGLDSRRNWRGAFEELRRIDSDRPLFPASIDAFIALADRWLAAERTAGRSTTELATELALHAEQLVMRGTGRWPERWSPVDRRSARSAARWWLEYLPERADRADQLLLASLADGDMTDPERQSALGWRLVALVALARFDEAVQLAEGLQAADPAARRRLIETLNASYDRLPEAQRAAWGNVVLRLAGESSGTAPRPADEPSGLELAVIRALASVGRRDEALSRGRILAAAQANDGSVQETWAELLTQTAREPAGLEAALSQWRVVERRSPPGSPRWFRAKYQMALVHGRLGNRDRALQLIAVTRELRPELGGDAQRGAFDILERQLQSGEKP